MSNESSKIAASDVLRNGLFWLNLVVVLLGTSWIPLVSMDITGPSGEVQRHQVPVYRCYQALFSEPSVVAVAAILIHLVVCFGISFVFRKWMLQAARGN